jgi:fructose-bisphosphate aldolase, class II
MPIATPGQYIRMLDAARTGGYAYAAINVTSSSTLNAVLRGLAESGSDGIVQLTPSGGAFAAGEPVDDAVLGARALAEWAHMVADRHPVLVALHTDHCPPDRVDSFIRPLLAESARRRSEGRTPLYNSHMFDGSSLPLADNLAIARALLGECAALDVLLEVEIGVVGGEEDGIRGDGDRDHLYTTVDDMLAVADALGTGEHGRYLLAAAFGNVHGVYAPGHVELRPGILLAGQQALAARSDSAFDLVFHGGSGSSRAEIREAVSYGVVKMNVDTELQYAYTRAVADHLFTHYDGVLRVDGGQGDKKIYDPRAWGRKAEGAMAARVGRACSELGSAGRSLLQRPGVGDA